MRLDKYLTQSHIGTRKKVHGILSEGMVTVNGQRVTDATYDVDVNMDQVTCDGEIVKHAGTVCYMFNKPQGCVTARSDEKEKTVLSYFSEEETGGLFMVGRLDKDTEGLLLLTNDGALDHWLMNPEHHMEKTYFFWALGELSEEDVSKIESGIDIQSQYTIRQNERLNKSDMKETKITKTAKLQILKQGMVHEFADEIPIPLHDDQVVSGLLTISEGKKHQVRRMLRAVGCKIFQLKRIAIGELQLDESLKPGEYRRLTDDEIGKLYKINIRKHT